MAKILMGYPRAKQYLIETGRKKAEVEAMSQAQVILLYTMNFYEELRDDLFKSMSVPYAEASPQLERAVAELRLKGKDEAIPVASMLLPALSSAKQAETRTQWVIARLRIIEALRINAAAHGGKLPEQLSDIREVPVPPNPFDDKPFTYHRDGNRAVLGCESGPRNHPWRYEITIAP
jgi:hypothetical protein